jgi:hypothetical protein
VLAGVLEVLALFTLGGVGLDLGMAAILYVMS